MDYEVRLAEAEPRRTAVVAARTTWEDFRWVWGELLGEVWDCLRAGGIDGGCRNVLLYLDGFPTLEAGVLLDRPCPLTGRVKESALPAGAVAMTVHRGPFGDVGAAHLAILAWCDANGREPSGPRWEVYGPHRDDPAQQWTEVYWLLR